MPLTYVLLLLFVLKLENHKNPPPPPPPNSKKKILQIWILCQNSLTKEREIRVIGIVLWTYPCCLYHKLHIV